MAGKAKSRTPPSADNLVPIPVVTAGMPQTDRFGIPYPPSLLADDPDARHRREEMVLEMIQEAFRTAEIHLGRERGGEAWKEVAAKARGRPPGVGIKQQQKDQELLAIYDEVMIHDGRPGPNHSRPASIPLDLARRIHERWPREFGNDAHNISRRLKALLKERRKQAAALSRQPNSLLAAAKSGHEE